MKYFKSIILIMATVVGLGSCSFLDKEPTRTTSNNYFNNETEAESFLRGVYAILTLSLIHISEPTRLNGESRMPSSA